MIYDKLSTVRNFFGRTLAVRPLTRLSFLRKGARDRCFQTAWQPLAALFVFLLLSSGAGAQGPTVTALPYVLTNLNGVVVVNAPGPVVSAPTSDTSGFGSLFGGGLGTVLAGTIGDAASKAATLAVRGLLYIKKADTMQNVAVQWQQDARNAYAKQEAILEDDGCDEVSLRRFKHPLVAMTSTTCALPEEEQAQQAEEDLEALNESEQASQEAIEAAEETAEAAEAAAETAETALEAAADALDVLEGIIDLAAAF